LRTVADVAAYYADYLNGVERTLVSIASLDGVPIAYLQAYRISDHPDYAAVVQVGDTDAGIDMLIGDPGSAGRGVGGPLLRAFVDDVVWTGTGADVAWIAPSTENRRGIRAYEKAGFTYVKTVLVKGAPEYFMMLERS
jgi:GNAT superfamily N-acetyltransferase